MVINSTAIDQELPWDRMWEYVLGEGDDQSSAYSLARRTSSRVSTPSPTPPLLPPPRKQRHEVPRYQTSTNVKDSEDTIDVQSDTWGRMSSGGAFTRSSSTKRQSSTGSEMSFPADFGDDYTMRQRRSSSTTGDNFPPPRQRSSASSTTLTESIISPVHTSSSKSRRDYTSASSETSIFQRKSSASSLTRNQHSLQDRYEMDQSVTSSLGREASLVRESSESGGSLSSISKTKRKIGFWRRRSDDIQLDETSTKESFDPAGITQQQQQSQRELEQSPPPKQEEDIASSPTTSEIQAGSGKQPSHRLLPPPKLPERPGSGRNIRKSSGSARVSNKTMGERSSSSSSHKYVTASRDDEATQESAGSEIMEQRDSGSPDTTLETDFSIEGPLSALFMTCNDADNFSIEGSGNKRSFANQNHSSPSAVAASAAAAAAAAVALRRIGDVNTCMIAPKESYKGNRGKNTAGGSKRGKKDSSASPMSAVNGNAVSTTTTTTKSNGAGVLFFDSLAKGIDDFLDPAFSYSLDDGGEQTLCLGEFSDDGSSSDDKRLQAANHPSQSKRTSTTNFNYSRKNRNRKDSKLTFGSYGDSRSRSSLSPITEEVSQSADRDTSFDNETTDGKRDDSFSRARSPSSQRQEKKEIRRETLPGYDAGGDETKRDRNTSSEVLSDRDADFFRFPADFKGKSVNKKSGDNGRRSGFASEQAGDQKDKDGFFSFAGSRSPGSISITGYDSGGITGTTSQVGFSSGHLSPTSASSTNGQIMQMHPVSPTSQSGVAGTTSAIETLSPSSLDGNGSRYTKVSSNMSRSGLTTTGAAYGQLSPSSSATRSGATTVAMGPTSPKTTGNRQALNRHSDYPSSPGLNPPLSFPSDLFLDGVVPSTPTETVVSRSGLVSTNHISLTSTTDLQSIRQEQEHKKKALLLTRQMTSPSDDAEDDEGTFSRSSWDDEGSERSRTGLVLGKHVKRHDSHSRSCIRLPICFSGRKSYEQVYAVSELDAATQRPSRQLSVDDGSDLLRKARCSPFTGTKQVSRSSHDTTTSKTHEETSGDMLNNSWMHNSDIQSLYEYDFDSTAHMSVVFDQFGGDPEEEMRVVLHDSPPEKVKEGLVEYNKVVVKVEASTVSQTDCAFRNGKLTNEFHSVTPATPGVDVIGRIYRIDAESSSMYKLNVGDRVMSLIKWGGNSRYLTVDPSKLVKVSNDLDPAEAVCLMETYLYAFQLIHSGQSRTARYRKNALQDKRILVVGEMASNIGRAIVQLANHAGCHNVVATTLEKHRETVSKMGVIPIDPEPANWKSFLNGSVDLLIQLSGRLSPTVAYGVLRPLGNMVIATSYHKADNRFGGPGNPAMMMACGRSDLSLDSRVSRYNVFRAWDDNREYIQDDLHHLTALLLERKVVPDVLDRVSLSNVGKAHALLETRRLRGFVVCEPWLVSKSRTMNL